MTEAAKCCQRPLPLIWQQPQIYLLQPIHLLQPPTQFLPVRSMVPHSKNEGDQVRVSNLHLIHWKKMAVFVYSSLCSLISEKLFLSERNIFAANRLDSQAFYCSFIFCCVPSLQHLWWPLSGHVNFLFLSHLPFVSFRCFPLISKWVFSIIYLDVVSVSKRQLTLDNVIHLELNSIFSS